MRTRSLSRPGAMPAEGPGEQAEPRLRRQHPPHRLVEPRHRHRTLRDEAGRICRVEAALHAHVDAGEEGEARGLAAVGGEAVGDQLLVGGVIRDDEAAKIPLAAQHVGSSQRLAVAGIPESSLNPAMTVPAPASTAAWKGGK